jgi:undecaprenyl-diphosphatase
VTLQKLIEKDVEISRSLRVLEKNTGIKPYAAVFAHSGDSWFWLAALILIAVFGDTFWKPWSLIMIFSLVVLAVFVIALKFLIRRRRPEGDWGQIYRATDPHSFPSGHAARAFLFAILAIGMGPFWLAWILIIWAPMVSLARVMMGVHYLSDVIAGILIGIVFGAAILLLLPVYQPHLLNWVGIH